MPEELMLARDGLPARPSGEWAKEKLWFLGRYIEIFNRGMRRKWGDRAFVDLMAGPGICRVRDSLDEFPGSPLIALRSPIPFTQVILVEEQPGRADALRQRTQAAGLRPRPTVLEGNCNDAAVIAEIRGCVTASTLAFCFIDLEGFDISFQTIQQLADGRRMDLVVTFPEQGITRNAPMAGSTQAETWTRFFGTGEWRNVLEECAMGRRHRDPQIELARLYARQVESLGYETNFLHETMKNKMRAPLYRPLFASKHPRGSDYWKKVSAMEMDGQRHLPI